MLFCVVASGSTSIENFGGLKSKKKCVQKKWFFHFFYNEIVKLGLWSNFNTFVIIGVGENWVQENIWGGQMPPCGATTELVALISHRK